MNLDEIRARLYSSTGITPVKPGPGWGKSKKRDENAARLAAYEGYTGLDKAAMDFMKQGYNVEDPTKTMTGLLGVLAPNLSGAPKVLSVPRIATKVASQTGIIPWSYAESEDEGRRQLIAQMQGYGAAGKGSRIDRGGSFMQDRWARQAARYKKGTQNIPNIISMLAGSYTDRIKDYLSKFQDLPDIRAAAEKVTEEEVPWT